MLFVSDSAKEKITDLLQDEDKGPGYFVRVAVKAGGCSGLSYEMTFDNESQAEDEVFEDKGIKIALDDFGAGYASLKYVRDLPIDVVKLDKHFTFNVADPATARLISFVSEVCEDLQLEMIGEGIETEEDKKMMLDLGCQIGQGYLMHRPDFLDSFNKKET